MKVIISRLAVGLTVALAMAGCATISEKRKIDYKSSRTITPLELPADLVAPPTDTVSATAGSAAITTYSEFATGQVKPGASSKAPAKVLPVFPEVRLDRDGQVRWLVVKGEPAAVWPRMREFVLAQGLLVSRENPASGMLETEWAENRAKVGSEGQRVLAKWLGSLYSTGTRDRFRLRLDSGIEAGTSEIYLVHQGMEEIISRNASTGESEGTRWQPRASEPDTETEMLRLLMVYLGVGETESVAATETVAPAKPAERATIKRPGTGSAASQLSLEESLERAWRRVGLTLDRAGFTVQDRDRSKGIYYIRYVDPDKKSKSAKEDEYQIQLKAADAGTLVEVLNKDGQSEATRSGERILGLLHEQLK